jgi:hypothetical protein
LPLRRSGFSPDYAATTTGICTGERSTGSHDPASTRPPRPPTTSRAMPLLSKVSALGLSPVHFRGPRARQVSCYALFEGWLLLSLPPCCLCSKTLFSLTLSQDLGALTLVWVVPLSVMRLTPHKPVSRLLPRRHLRSSKASWALSDPWLPIGALQRRLRSAQARLGSASVGTSNHQTRLAFGPLPRVRGLICTSRPFRTSTKLSPGFILLEARSSGF